MLTNQILSWNATMNYYFSHMKILPFCSFAHGIIISMPNLEMIATNETGTILTQELKPYSKIYINYKI
jgi:hypothetical protein